MTNVFVAGIAGSGKTSLSTTLARQLPARRVSIGTMASAIMREIGAPSRTIEATPCDRLVAGQRELARQLREARLAERRKSRWIIDGHLILPGTTRSDFFIPDDVILACETTTLLLCDPPPSETARRIACDLRSRPGVLRRRFAARAAAEREQAETIAARCDLRLVVWNGREPFRIADLEDSDR